MLKLSVLGLFKINQIWEMLTYEVSLKQKSENRIAYQKVKPFPICTRVISLKGCLYKKCSLPPRGPFLQVGGLSSCDTLHACTQSVLPQSHWLTHPFAGDWPSS